MASFALLLIFNSICNAASSLERIAKDPQWHALLHIDSSGTRLDPNYLLSKNAFSPYAELLATLELFSKKQVDSTSCQYIGRHYFLTNLKQLKLPSIHCPKYWEFTQKAPADIISLVFASENLSQPASIMGHVMLALSNPDKSIEHSIAFSTIQNTNNPIQLVWKYLINGQPGDFLLKPLNNQSKQYLQTEQRSLWSYPLNLAIDERELLLRHIWELKHNQMTYSFASHNCATLIMDILRVIRPSITEDRSNWVSPIDVVKSANSKDLIKETQLSPSSSWKLRLLSEYSDPLAPHQTVDNEKPHTVLAGLLSQVQNQYQFETGSKTYTDWQQTNSWLLSKGLQPEHQQLEINSATNPIFKQDDSQWGIGFSRRNQEQNWLQLRWMPASHQLMDDNSHYTSENELKLLDVAIRTSKNKFELDYIHLYSVQSYLNSNPLIGGLSGRFNMGVDRFTDFYSEDKLGLFIDTGLGKTYGLHKDISVYGLMQLKLRQDSNRFINELGPELGLIARFVGKMKSRFSLSQTWLNSKHELLEYRWQHGFNHWKSFGVNFEYSQKRFSQTIDESCKLETSFYY